MSAAAANFERSLRAASGGSGGEEALAQLARDALAEGREDEALAVLGDAATSGASARLWQWRALLERALDDHGQALASFETAARLAPLDPSIAHGRARVALEAGISARALFTTALQLAPGDGDVLLGYAASMFVDGEAKAAEALLDDVLARSPFWIQGHVQLAQLRSMMGKKPEASASLERSLKSHPAAEQLWVALFRLLLQAERFAELDEAIARARRSSLNAAPMLRHYETIASIERRHTDRADALLASSPADMQQPLLLWRIRHLLRTGRIAPACQAIDQALASEIAPDVWPYASVAWRLANDPRSEWLEGDLSRLVSVIDLIHDQSELVALERVLRKLHLGKGEYLDQSIRGGSQTDGPLFTNVEPAIRALRARIVAAVEQHVAKLPPSDRGHPLLGLPRNRRIGFSGSWSVLLKGAGYHANHVHPQGWISSALYIHVPDRLPSDPAEAGWLTIGEPQKELGIALQPLMRVEPKPGRLVLFPSYSWHGTRPFSKGERLTVAFDVKRPS